MRKLNLALLTSLALAIPAHAATGADQSYITFDDGGTIVRQAEDGREIDARVNLPIYPGDEVITNRRGRTEIRLADGNVIALDRSTDVRFRSINDTYDTEGNEATIVELKYGHVAVERTDFHHEPLRLDTPNASYVARNESVYAVETDSRGVDRLSAFYGDVEVRTPARTSIVREGEEAKIDDQGLYGQVASNRATADEFERWFNHRSQRYLTDNSQYLDGSLAYSDADLQQYGSWTFVSSLGTWGWRPYVGAGWRPYYYGSWIYGPNNCLTWFSSEPWGWVPYHYGRWAYDPGFGWVWVPGYTYSPAWVYFAYGPGYFGWVPAGWYDCYRPYYGWAYRPYQRARLDFGFGFYGRVRLNEIDLRPWTFINPNQLVSTRVDQAALSVDAIRQRIARDPAAGMAAVTGNPARFNRNEIRNPGEAIGSIARGGFVNPKDGKLGGATIGDMTPFFRRDPELPGNVRERIVRSAPAAPPAAIGTVAGSPGRSIPSGSGVPSPGTPGTIEGRIPPHGDSPDSPPPRNGVVGRDGPSRPALAPPNGIDAAPNTDWRRRVSRPSNPPGVTTPSNTAPSTSVTPDDSWRGRVPRRDLTPRNGGPASTPPVERGAPVDIPRRIIDRIGGARIYGEQPPPPRDTAPRAAEPRPSSPPAAASSAPPPPPRERASAPPPSRGSSGGHVERKH
ncbi:MAG TPA: DUF6600 domain-containing protein [Thermoanaerobaculia bacterium]|nr:DUF6600 domain-containing protein [Thermoanaerobaculia bacterium]